MTRPERARAMYAEGIGYKRIGKALGVSRDRARDWARPERRRRLAMTDCPKCGGRMQKGSARCGRCKRAEVDARAERLIDLRRQGLLNYEIAEREGIKAQTVANLFVMAARRGLDVPPSPYRRR